MYNTCYEDFGSLARDFYELRLLLEAWKAAMVEKIRYACRPECLMSQKTACTYEVYATTWGKSGKYTGGYV